MEGFLDLFRFPWIQGRLALPGEGGEYWFKLDYTPSRTIQLSARYRSYRNMIENGAVERPLPGYLYQQKEQLRVELHYQLTDRFSTQSRLEYIHLKENGQSGRAEGFLTFAEVSYFFRQRPLVITIREQYYESKDYKTRVYAYEKDLNSTGSSRSFYGNGWRWYLHISASPFSIGKAGDRPKLTFKFAHQKSLQNPDNQLYMSSEVPLSTIEAGVQLIFFF